MTMDYYKFRNANIDVASCIYELNRMVRYKEKLSDDEYFAMVAMLTTMLEFFTGNEISVVDYNKLEEFVQNFREG